MPLITLLSMTIFAYKYCGYAIKSFIYKLYLVNIKSVIYND